MEDPTSEKKKDNWAESRLSLIDLHVIYFRHMAAVGGGSSDRE